MSKIQKLRQKIIDKDYYISSHAEDEMLDDKLERADIKKAILKGKIVKKFTEDVRGTRYRIEGPARDDRIIHIICRYGEDGSLIIITAYALTEEI